MERQAEETRAALEVSFGSLEETSMDPTTDNHGPATGTASGGAEVVAFALS